MDSSFAAKRQVPLLYKAQVLSIHLADGSAIKSGPLIHETTPLPVTMANLQQKLRRMDMISLPLFPAILSMPWLQAHNPYINWVTGEVMFLLTASNCAFLKVPVNLLPCYVWTPTLSYANLFQRPTMTSWTFLVKREWKPFSPIEPMTAPLSSFLHPFGRLFLLTELEQGTPKVYINDNL